MSYPINYPTPQGANIQIFKEGGSTSDWVKPQGASFVWFTLIGAGGPASSGVPTGGGSGAVTNFMGPAFLMPDVLRVVVGAGRLLDSGVGGGDSQIRYQQKDGTGYTLLNAQGGGSAGTAGAATTAGPFAAMGFYQSVAGQAGNNGNISASTTTFLSGGTISGSVTANYGYSVGTDNGFFQMQPIIVGVGGGGGTQRGRAGIGCGGGNGGALGTGTSGDGLVVIITW